MPNKIKSEAQIMRKVNRLKFDFKIFAGNQEIIPDNPAIIIKPEMNVPSPNDKAQNIP